MRDPEETAILNAIISCAKTLRYVSLHSSNKVIRYPAISDIIRSIVNPDDKDDKALEKAIDEFATKMVMWEERNE